MPHHNRGNTNVSHTARRIVLFDGVCHLCSGSVRFIIRRDPQARFTFAPLQSTAGQALLRQFGLPTEVTDTFVLVEANRAYTRSTAALRVARGLSGLWPLAYAAIIVPRFLRDAIYTTIARNRYRWFGQSEVCMLPTPEISERFLPVEVTADVIRQGRLAWAVRTRFPLRTHPDR